MTHIVLLIVAFLLTVVSWTFFAAFGISIAEAKRAGYSKETNEKALWVGGWALLAAILAIVVMVCA